MISLNFSIKIFFCLFECDIKNTKQKDQFFVLHDDNTFKYVVWERKKACKELSLRRDKRQITAKIKKNLKRKNKP